MKTSPYLKLFAILLLFLVGLFIVIPFVDYSVMEPEKFHHGDKAIKVLDENYSVGDFICTKTIEGSIAEPLPNSQSKWYRAVIKLTEPPFVFQVVRFTHAYSGCEEWIVVDELDIYRDSTEYCVRVRYLLATTCQ